MDAILVEDINFLKAFLNQDLYALAGKPLVMQEEVIVEAKPQQEVKAVEIKAESIQVPEIKAVTQQPIVTPKPAEQLPSISYYGGNAGQLLILVSDAYYEYLSAEDLGLLLKILGAIKKTEKDIALVNLGRGLSVTWPQLNLTFNPTVVLTFGLPKTSFPMLVLGQQYTVVPMGPYKCLNAEALSALQGNDNLKRLLWTALKTL